MTFLDWILILALIFVLMGLFMAWEAKRLRRFEKLHNSHYLWTDIQKEKEDWIKKWRKEPGGGND